MDKRNMGSITLIGAEKRVKCNYLVLFIGIHGISFLRVKPADKLYLCERIWLYAEK